MVSVASLLNPIPSLDPRNHPTPFFSNSQSPDSPVSTNYTSTSSPYGSPRLPSHHNHVRKKAKMVKDGAIFAKGKIKGTVNYPPYEANESDPESLRLIQKFAIWPNNGCMQEYARHIPYNSEKKSFLHKTGRESFEVFQYIFRLPGDEKEYTVMWDYNIGLVRITPFFKCLKYTKTTPAKMLNLNNGLKEITHSITGGALAAQGYWMPYSCALAICLTFCDPISGGLIPLFGPDFPRRCVPSNSPLYGRMVIDPSIIATSTQEAQRFRAHYSSHAPSRVPTPISTAASTANDSDVSPRSQPLDSPLSSPKDTLHTKGKRQRLRLKRAFTGDSMYSTSETDYDSCNTSPRTEGYMTASSPISPASYTSSSRHGDGTSRTPWSPAYLPSSNMPAFQSPTRQPQRHRAVASPDASPWLSAIPRSVLPSSPVKRVREEAWRSPGLKRRFAESEESDRDADYDGEESDVGSGSSNGDTKVIGGKSGGGEPGADQTGRRLAVDIEADADADKKAAWLLMKLSVRDANVGVSSSGQGDGAGDRVCAGEHDDEHGPRVKRRRAVSY